MKRFLALFAVMLVICLALMWGMMAQNGYDLFAPEMSGMLLVAVLVAAYVAFRISRILAKRAEREKRLADTPKSDKKPASKAVGVAAYATAISIILACIAYRQVNPVIVPGVDM